jgi:hypothetical protein
MISTERFTLPWDSSNMPQITLNLPQELSTCLAGTGQPLERAIIEAVALRRSHHATS